eukprot:7350294-Ditylum_brightwellii.AAC.1
MDPNDGSDFMRNVVVVVFPLVCAIQALVVFSLSANVARSGNCLLIGSGGAFYGVPPDNDNLCGAKFSLDLWIVKQKEAS